MSLWVLASFAQISYLFFPLALFGNCYIVGVECRYHYYRRCSNIGNPHQEIRKGLLILGCFDWEGFLYKLQPLGFWMFLWLCTLSYVIIVLYFNWLVIENPMLVLNRWDVNWMSCYMVFKTFFCLFDLFCFGWINDVNRLYWCFKLIWVGLEMTDKCSPVHPCINI